MAACRVSPVPPLQWFGATYVEIFRNAPLSVLMLLFVFGLTKAGVGPYSFFASAVVVLAVYTSAFLAETFRAGINTVAAGQAEAARAIGLTFPQTLGIVVFPQALRTVVGPIGNLFIALIKNSSIASVISVLELSKRTNLFIDQQGVSPIPVFLGAAVAYLILTLPSGFLVGYVERRVAIKR